MGDVKSHIPNNLKRYRRMSGFSQKEVATMLGLESTGCISRWEHGTTIPSWIHILKLSFLYSTLPNELYGDLWAQVKQELRDKKSKMIHKE